MSRPLALLSSVALSTFLASLGAAPASAQGLAVEKVMSGLQDPVFLTSPAGDDRLFVLEQNSGLIRIFEELAVALTPQGVALRKHVDVVAVEGDHVPQAGTARCAEVRPAHVAEVGM